MSDLMRCPTNFGWRWAGRCAVACAFLALGVSLSACGHSLRHTETKLAQEPLGEPVSLAINGFNYTDTVISYFSVAGQGGSNIYVSSPTSGGGKTTCCVTWRPGTPLPRPIKVEWLRVVNGKDRWCERMAELKGPVPDKPSAIGVHFMPDGDVQVEITHGYPKLKLRLENYDDGHRKAEGNLVHDEETARCRDVR